MEERLKEEKKPHEKILEILTKKDEITWRSIIYELVKSEQMNPWDIDLSLLTAEYIETIKKLKKLDLRISGKVLLAAAILLKIKSNKLVGEDISYLDSLIAQQEEEELLDFEEPLQPREKEEIPKNLIPRTPQPRKRKVSIYDLMAALERALEVKRRRILKNAPPTNITIPEKKRDVSEIIKEIYGKIKSFFLKYKKGHLTFSKLIPSNSKEDKIYVFVPLLHLTTQRKIDLFQQQHFGDISIILRKTEEELKKELTSSKLLN